ncbi:subtilisin-like protease SBT1.2 [Tanacetum coccineum]
MTQNPRFFRLHKKSGLRKLSSFGKGMIIRVLDIGIVLTHASFSHHGMLHPFSKWKGLCELDASSCNDKIIGARSLNIGAMALNVKMKVESPLDDSGYGTHTLSYLTMVSYFDVQYQPKTQAKNCYNGTKLNIKLVYKCMNSSMDPMVEEIYQEESVDSAMDSGFNQNLHLKTRYLIKHKMRATVQHHPLKLMIRKWHVPRQGYKISVKERDVSLLSEKKRKLE